MEGSLGNSVAAVVSSLRLLTWCQAAWQIRLHTVRCGNSVVAFLIVISMAKPPPTYLKVFYGMVCELTFCVGHLGADYLRDKIIFY